MRGQTGLTACRWAVSPCGTVGGKSCRTRDAATLLLVTRAVVVLRATLSPDLGPSGIDGVEVPGLIHCRAAAVHMLVVNIDRRCAVCVGDALLSQTKPPQLLKDRHSHAVQLQAAADAESARHATGTRVLLLQADVTAPIGTPKDRMRCLL